MANGELEAFIHTTQPHDLWQQVNEVGASAGIRNSSYAAALQQLDALDGARRSRVLLGESGIPESMTLASIIGEMVTVGFSFTYSRSMMAGYTHR
jgi:hypothetical protein